MPKRQKGRHAPCKAFKWWTGVWEILGLSAQRLSSPCDRALTSHAVHAGTKARLRSKHNLLATLVERVRDSSAYTRARVLQTWSHLAEAAAIPLGHWVCVTELAVGALPSPERSFHQGCRAAPSLAVPWRSKLGLVACGIHPFCHRLLEASGIQQPFWISHSYRKRGGGLSKRAILDSEEGEKSMGKVTPKPYQS